VTPKVENRESHIIEIDMGLGKKRKKKLTRMKRYKRSYHEFIIETVLREFNNL